jgi:hypothetical protein
MCTSSRLLAALIHTAFMPSSSCGGGRGSDPNLIPRENANNNVHSERLVPTQVLILLARTVDASIKIFNMTDLGASYLLVRAKSISALNSSLPLIILTSKGSFNCGEKNLNTILTVCHYYLHRLFDEPSEILRI